MAEVDRAPRPYRDVVDALWWAEQRLGALLQRRAALVERLAPGRDDPHEGWPRGLATVERWLYAARKDAEAVALARLYVREQRPQEALAVLTGCARVHLTRWAAADAERRP